MNADQLWEACIGEALRLRDMRQALQLVDLARAEVGSDPWRGRSWDKLMKAVVVGIVQAGHGALALDWAREMVAASSEGGGGPTCKQCGGGTGEHGHCVCGLPSTW